jgi:hypothetical protein
MVSGDADLLALNPFRDIPIVTPAIFVQGAVSGLPDSSRRPVGVT